MKALLLVCLVVGCGPGPQGPDGPQGATGPTGAPYNVTRLTCFKGGWSYSTAVLQGSLRAVSCGLNNTKENASATAYYVPSDPEYKNGFCVFSGEMDSVPGNGTVKCQLGANSYPACTYFDSGQATDGFVQTFTEGDCSQGEAQ